MSIPSSISIPKLGKYAFSFSTGELAKQANGSISAAYGDTVVLVAVCMANEAKPNQSFFPLTVEYQERTYAMGKIPGGFFKREGRPKENEILSARLIDRPLRPLFPQGITNEIQIVAIVLSSDGENAPDTVAINAASCALMVSDIPFYKPVGAVRVGKIGEDFILNPSYQERSQSIMDLVVVAREEEIVMLEGDFQCLSEGEIFNAVKFAHPFIKEIIELQKKIQKQSGKVKREYDFGKGVNLELKNQMQKVLCNKFEDTYGGLGKNERENLIGTLLKECVVEFVDEEKSITEVEVTKLFFLLEKEFIRNKILKEEKRSDGRKLTDIRNIDCKVEVLPRTHGSALFTRGQTQALATTTLGTSSDEQFVEALEGERTKRFMLHYSFPAFSVGEVKPMRGVSRREIGHGALAERSLIRVIPSKEEFPYTIRLVSEILESNGSSSMATVCASSLSLMDAGVPIKYPVAGIALGLVREEDSYKILTDIAGLEDHHGDMDFKIAGTKDGITAIQLDIKIDGISYQIIEESLSRAKQVRGVILDKMTQSLIGPRQRLSQYAPKIISFQVNPDKIGAIIGPGGKVIRRLSRDYNVTIDIDDELNMVSVVAQNQDNLDKAVKEVKDLARDAELGEIFEGRITRLANFGAFCEILPNQTGLIHVSEISNEYVKDVASVLKEGDIVKVKVIGLDPQGKINLSIKQAT